MNSRKRVIVTTILLGILPCILVLAIIRIMYVTQVESIFTLQEYENAQELGSDMLKFHGSGNNYVFQLREDKLLAANEIFICFIVFVCLIFLATGMLIAYIMQRWFWKPLQQLREAVHQVYEGNLDFELDTNHKHVDVMNSLYDEFEEMRKYLKETTELRLQYEEGMRELVGNVSHDLKSPLTSIIGYSEGLIEGVANTQEKRDKYLQIIHKRATDMYGTVENILNAVRIENGSVTYQFEMVSVEEYETDGMEEVSSMLGLHGISHSSVNTMPKASRVIMDPWKIKDVIQNVISNAIKYAREEAPEVIIVLSVYEEDPSFMLTEIRDNGLGIPKEAVERVFDKFYRADSARGFEVGGNGLGLAICKKIIEHHGGKIWIESEEGVGTSVFYTLRREVNNE